LKAFTKDSGEPLQNILESLYKRIWRAFTKESGEPLQKNLESHYKRF